MTREEIIDFCEMKAELEPENEDIFTYIIKVLEQETVPREHYEHEYFLRKELDFKVARLEKQIAEQETCGDCMSRKAVNELFDSEIKMYKERIETRKGSNYHDETERIKEFRSRIANAEYWQNKIKALPPVTPAQKWIPTSERQPKENGNYLALYRTSDGTASLEFMMVDHCNAGGGWLHEENGRKAYKKVIAWMPLPEPPAESEVEE